MTAANPLIVLPLHIIKSVRGDIEVFDSAGVALMYFDCAEMPQGREMAEFLIARVNACAGYDDPATMRADAGYYKQWRDGALKAQGQRDELAKALRNLQQKVDQLIYRPSVDDSRLIDRHTLELRKEGEISRAALASFDTQPENERDQRANELVQSWVDNGDAQPGPAPSAERRQFLLDVLTTAAEGGCNYWAIGRNAERDDDLNWLSFDLRDAEDDEAEWHHVDTVTVERGIFAILSGQVKICNKTTIGQIASGNAQNDGADIDANAADCIIQAGIFGEIVFG